MTKQPGPTGTDTVRLDTEVASERTNAGDMTGRQRRKRPVLATGSAAFLALLLAFAALGPPLLRDRALAQNLDLRFVPAFTADHGFWFILGGDGLGRSVLARLIVGSRTTLLDAVCAVALACLVGFIIGTISGYVGGWLDAVTMRLADVIMTFPSLLLALAVLYVLTPGELSLIFVLAVTRIPVFMRTTRALTLEIRQRTFVEAARAMGATPLRVLRREIRPLVVPTLLTIAMLDLAIVMLAAAGLSFLGVGLQPPAISWGLMVAEGRDYLTQAWWVTFLPGLAIVATAFAANVLSNHYRTARDPLQAPRRRGRS